MLKLETIKKWVWIIIFLPYSHLLLGQNPNPNSEVDKFILEIMKTNRIPGMSTLAVKDGEIVWVESYGWADVENKLPAEDNTVFLLASVSKLITGTSLMKLFEDKQIKLDDNISDYLPFEIRNPHFNDSKISFRMLMTHSSSIKDNGDAMQKYYSVGDPTISLESVVYRYFSKDGEDYDPNKNFNKYRPGSKFDYSNMATALLGYLVEEISGVSFNEFCIKNLFEKLCMENTSWYLADFDTNKVARPYSWTGNMHLPYAHYGFADYPNGQLRSTVIDLANFVITFLQNGIFDDKKILSMSTTHQMLTPQIPLIKDGQGLNWYLENIFLNNGDTIKVWGHNGGESGVSTDLYLNMEDKIGVVVLNNGEASNLKVVDELYSYALKLKPKGVGNPDCNPVFVKNKFTQSAFEFKLTSRDGDFEIISTNGLISDYTIYNSIGQVIEKKNVGKNRIIGQIKSIGIFIIQIDVEGSSFTKKIIRW